MNRLFKQKYINRALATSEQQSSTGAVLVELTYVVVILILLSTSTLELVNFIRHHKMAMSLSYEVANQIFKECSDVQRNKLEEDSVGYQTSGTPGGIKDCFTRNTESFQPFLDSLGVADASGYACPTTDGSTPRDLEATDVLPAYIFVELLNPSISKTTRYHRLILESEAPTALTTCLTTYQLSQIATDTTYNAVINAPSQPSVVIRSVVHMPYKGILLTSGFLAQMFSADGFISNGGISARTVL